MVGRFIKIERCNNRTALDTTPANISEISIVSPPPCEKDGYHLINGVCGAGEGVRLSPLPSAVVVDTLHTILISFHTREEKGGVLGNREESFIFS